MINNDVRDTLVLLRQEIRGGVADGLKDGAVHIAEALAKPTQEDIFKPFQNGVTLVEVDKAIRLLAEEHTYVVDGAGVQLARQGTYGPTSQAHAWATLRRAIGLRT